MVGGRKSSIFIPVVLFVTKLVLIVQCAPSSSTPWTTMTPPDTFQIKDRVVVIGERHNFAYFPVNSVPSGQGDVGVGHPVAVPVHLQYALSIPAESLDRLPLSSSDITRAKESLQTEQQQPYYLTNTVPPSVSPASPQHQHQPVPIVWQPLPDRGLTVLSHADGTPFHALRPQHFQTQPGMFSAYLNIYSNRAHEISRIVLLLLPYL